MAAAAIAMLVRMKLSNEAAIEITSGTGQGITTVVGFAEMDKDGVDLMFRQLARPGGVDAAGVRNPGIKISALGHQTFGHMCYYANHMLNRVDRALTFPSITLATVKKLKAQELLEKNHKDPVTVPTIDFKNWPKTMDAVDQYIKGHRGVDGSSLGYVTRKSSKLFPPAAVDDPKMGTANSVYMSHDDEVVARHRIIDLPSATPTLLLHEKSGPFMEEFLSERKRVWDLLCSLLQDTDAVTVIKPYKVKCDGRGAFLAVWNHYLGPNNVDHMANEAEKTLSTSRYHTEGRTFNFEKLVLMHLKAHLILEGLVEHGYVGIDERSKVRHLMESIKTKSLDAAKAQIMANADLRTDFNACVTLFKDFIAQERSANGAERQISAASSAGGGNSIDYNRYVPDPEWQELSKDERDKYTAARKAAREAKKASKGGGGGDGKNKDKSPKKNSKQAKWMKKEIKRQEAKALTAKDDDDEEEVPMKGEDGGGHNMRQKDKKKSALK